MRAVMTDCKTGQVPWPSTRSHSNWAAEAGVELNCPEPHPQQGNLHHQFPSTTAEVFPVHPDTMHNHNPSSYWVLRKILTKSKRCMSPLLTSFPRLRRRPKHLQRQGKNANAKLGHAHKQTINISYLSICCHTSKTAHESTDKHQQTLTFESSIKHIQQNNKAKSKTLSRISESYLQDGFTLFTAAWKLFHYLCFKERSNKIIDNKGSFYHNNTWPAVFCPSFGGFFFCF